MTDETPPSPESQLGQLGSYLLGHALAVRERSTVYEAVDVRDDSRAAVKVLAARRPGWTRPEVDFGREVRLAEAVEHPHLLRIRDWGWEGDRGWIAYDLAAHGSLQDRIGAAGQMDSSEVRRLATQIGSALLAVHQAGLLHRDVKPSNILLDGDRYLLGDFGAVRIHDPETTSTVVGSVPYMAPEQSQGQLSPESDVYCLGATLYRAWTGALPPPLAQREPDWPAQTEADRPLRSLVAAMLRPHPASRPRLEEVEDLLGAPRRRQPTLMLAGMAGIALALSVFGITTFQDDPEPLPAATEQVASSLAVASATEPGTTATMSPAPDEYPHGALVMTDQNPRLEWGPNPVYYLYRGMRFHITSAEVLNEQITFMAPRIGEERLGWDGWPECCVRYSEIEHLMEGPELVYADERSEGLLVRREGDDRVWIIHDGVPQPATPELLAASAGPQTPDHAILLAPALLDALPSDRVTADAGAATPACLVPGGGIAELYEVHRAGLGEVVGCEQPVGDGGAFARWENGTIWWSPETDAHLVVFSIDQAFWEEGGASGWLGYPTSEEADEPSGQWQRMTVFQHGVITWAADVGTEAMTREEYLEAGGSLSE